jgi:DNA-binding response OmpR family regulator
VRIPQTLSKITGPSWGVETIVAGAYDLRKQHVGRPIGPRIAVSGRVTDENVRPLSHTLVEIWQANSCITPPSSLRWLHYRNARVTTCLQDSHTGGATLYSRGNPLNILVVEDDFEMARLLVRGLQEEAHQVDLARDGFSALALSKAGSFDLVLLDVMLPGVNGIEVAKQLRCRKADFAVLMLTARDALPDIVKGLDAGADDYLTKPFYFQELLARVRALGRRNTPKPKHVLEVGDLVLETNTFRTFRNGSELRLSFTEFRLLELLARNGGRVVSRNSIIETLWGPRREVEENTLDAFVCLLRRKIEGSAPDKLIQTHRGLGYSIGAHHCA